MGICHTSLRVALLGSTLALAALAPATAAGLSRADRERIEAAMGRHSSALASNAAALFGAAHRPGYRYKVLHNFAGGATDGLDSTAEVTFDSIGNMFGVTEGGGTAGAGTLFEIDAEGDEGIVHSFGSSGDGSIPDGAVIIDLNNNMFGTTNDGGASNNGTIWKLAADDIYSVVHSFTADEGNFIRGRLIEDRKGNLYGTALFGGTTGYGTVFRYSHDGKLKVLHTFGGTDGQYPEHGVVSDRDGNLFGVTAFGGTTDNGAVYEIAKDGTFSTLYSFTGGNDGGFLYGGLAIDKAGNLYGSTDSGGANGEGTVFKLAPNGTLTTLYSFTGGTDGGGPEGDMLLAGKDLYSTATTGVFGEGGVYEITATGKEKVLAGFTPGNGDGYSAGLTVTPNAFYGTTAGGGSAGYGVVFSLTKK